MNMFMHQNRNIIRIGATLACAGLLFSLLGCSKNMDEEFVDEAVTESSEVSQDTVSSAATESVEPSVPENASDTATTEVEGAYHNSINSVKGANAGKDIMTDEFIDQSQAYLNVFMRTVLLKNSLEKYPEEDHAEAEQFLFGFVPENNEQALQYANELLSYLRDKGGDYLAPFMVKLSTLNSVSGSFEPQKISFTVNNTQALLDELHISAEVLGRFLAMTDIYASQISFTDTGFDFLWDGTGGVYQIVF